MSASPAVPPRPHDPGDAVSQLCQALGRSAVSTDPGELARRLRDRSDAPASATPLAHVRPASTADVAQVMRIASAHRIAVVPQGALTGLAGGANALDGAILLDLTAMDAIVRIDPVEMVAVVQPGVLTSELAERAAAEGLFYAPDPGSIGECSIGGNVATNAGGMRCVKYGVTGDSVRSLEVVLADGEVLRTRPPTVKGVGGLDLTSLFVGSEGTLGVITEITVSLLPAPGPTLGITASFASVDDALATANEIIAGPHRPSALEFFDSGVIDAVRAHEPQADLPVGAKGWLLVLSDALSGAEEDIDCYARSAREHGAIAVQQARDADEVEQLMVARRSLNVSMRAVRGGSLNEDVAVPRSRLSELLLRLDALAASSGLPIATAGHVGDGNLHPVIVYDPADAEQTRIAHETHWKVLALAGELGGTVTGEHGIGLEKLGAVDAELGPRIRGIERSLKAVLDPDGLLNPGKKY